MTSSYPAFLPLLLGIVAAAVTALGLVGYGLPAIGRGAAARGGAALTGAFAAIVYAWGLASLFLDESSTAQACHDANPSLYGQVSSYSVSYLPPALNCRMSTDGSYEAAVPGFLTPVMTGCGVIAVTLALIAVLEHRRTTRPEHLEHPEKRNT
ncbi:hypothetical protein AB0L74_32640 [Streptomyces sp. NPDC052020]|uniref:hypothetical protein n=1 Tax=Streptomyces sp. NPDC052020 TaxID=3155677 RepID=UPI0034472649